MCAECHRRAEDQQPQDISTENVDIVRFQPVGLSQSRCFQQAELSCISCHDPHRPLSMQNSLGDWQCIQCHTTTSSASPAETLHHGTDQTPAAAAQVSSKGLFSSCAAHQTSDCVSCHMPKVTTAPGLAFTDHWIRIRRESEQPE